MKIGATALGLIALGVVGNSARHNIFDGPSAPTPMSASYVFPTCKDHNPIVMDGTFPPGMVIQTGPNGSKQLVDLTVGGPGQLTYKDNGAVRVFNEPGQPQSTANYVLTVITTYGLA